MTERVAEAVLAETGVQVPYSVGTMIEVPRAALIADKIARARRVLLVRHQRPHPDDVRLQPRRHRQVPARSTCEKKLLPLDPFAVLDQEGVGELIRIGIERGRRTRAGPQGRHLRRARRRAVVGGVLPPRGHDLRVVLAVHDPDRAARRPPRPRSASRERHRPRARRAQVHGHGGRTAVKLSGARIVLECLKREGVDIIFGLPGGAVLPIYDVLYDFEGLRHILVRQEAAAGHAAEGYARTTGKVGVCLVTSGPAATNLVTALQDALMDSIPIVAFTGQVPTHLIGNDAFQEADNVGITRSATKHNFLVKDGKDLGADHPGGVSHRVHRAARGRCTSTCPRTSSSRSGASIWPEKVHLRSYNPTYDGHPGQIKKAARSLVAGQAAGALRGRRRHLLRRPRRAARAGRADPDPGHADPHGPGRLPDGASAVASTCWACTARTTRTWRCTTPTASSRSARASTTASPARWTPSRRTPRSSTSTSTPRRSRRTSRCDIPIVGDCKRVLRKLLRGRARGAEGRRARRRARGRASSGPRRSRSGSATSRSATTGTTTSSSRST